MLRARSSPYVQLSDGTQQPLTALAPVVYIIHDAWRVGLTGDYVVTDCTFCVTSYNTLFRVSFGCGMTNAVSASDKCWSYYYGLSASYYDKPAASYYSGVSASCQVLMSTQSCMLSCLTTTLFNIMLDVLS